LEEMEVKQGEIRIGATVKLKDLKHNDEVTYTLVDAAEADLSKGRISVSSPVAEALLGLKEGESVEIKLPIGPIKYKVLKVSREL